MHERKKSFRPKKTVSILCIVFCLILAVPSRFELSAKADSTSVTVGPSQSIQAAINNATAGETIFVSPGIYNENLQVNQTVSLIGEDANNCFINGTQNNTQFIVNIEANNVTIQGFTIECAPGLNPTSGVALFLFGGCTISNDIIEDSQQGINVQSSHNNIIADNIITNNTSPYEGAITLIASSDNLLYGNVISNNNGGIYMYTASGNTFSGNTFAYNYPLGETMDSYCFYNTFYDNNFLDEFQVRGNSISNFDNGVQGNYWSNYAGQDRGDGTGIESYTVAPGNRDNHPLMGEFLSYTATYTGEPYQVSIISNSTISDFAFEVGTETGNEIIQFNVTSVEGTDGFSRIAIPKALMSTSVVVLVGDKETNPTWLNNTQNTAANTLYLTYTSRNQTILIISSETMNLYNQLLTQYLNLNATYYELLSNYTTQFGTLSNETAQLQLSSNYIAQLNSTYGELLSSYANLLGNYSQLQQTTEELNASYQQHLYDENQDQQNVHSLMYIFAAGTAILIVATVYFSKRMYSQPKEPPEKREPILTQLANSVLNKLTSEKVK
jgi:parallel beta-helix repeat protein